MHQKLNSIRAEPIVMSQFGALPTTIQIQMEWIKS